MLRNLASLIVIALSAFVVSACTGDDPDPLPARIVAFLDRDAAGQRQALEDRIRTLPGVTSVAFVSKQEAYDRTKKRLENSPELLGGMTPDNSPESFEAVVADGSLAEAVQLAIGAFDGISQTVLAVGDGDVSRYEQAGVLVRLESGVTDEQRGAVERLVQGLPRTESVKYETGEQTKARLLRRCKGELAAALERVPAHDVPASFRFRIGLHGGKVPQLADLQTMDGVASMVFVPVETV